MKAPWTDPALRELLALAALSALVAVLRWLTLTSYSRPFLLLQAQRSLLEALIRLR
jgi:hypothetical protein